MAESETNRRYAEWPLDLTALLGGAVLTLSLSPFDFWPFAFLSPALLYLATKGCSVRRALFRFYLFNVALFGIGVSWIWVSVHEHGNAGLLLATFLVSLLVLVYATLCLPLGYLFSRYCRGGILSAALGFCALWVLQEWIRTWFLTGFPWLYAGYGVMNTPLVSLAPVFGVFGVSLATVVIGVSLVIVAQTRRWVCLLLPGAILLSSLVLGALSFTEVRSQMTVSLIQGNIDQHQKWLPQMRAAIMRHYVAMSSEEWGRDLIVWPEAAITVFREDAAGFLEELDERGKESGSTLVLGIPDRSDNDRFQNTVLSVGTGEGQYIKRRLVPFGEYVPLEGLLRGVIQLFDLPMARNTTGPAGQPALTAGPYSFGTLICYEIVYPALVRSSVPDPDFLLTVSNDTWFGRSIGPDQHLQMARMRAIELGRDLVRATNNGISAVIGADGEVRGAAPQFETAVLRQKIDIRSGQTPYRRFGDLPIILLSLLMVAAGLLISTKHGQ